MFLPPKRSRPISAHLCPGWHSVPHRNKSKCQRDKVLSASERTTYNVQGASSKRRRRWCRLLTALAVRGRRLRCWNGRRRYIDVGAFFLRSQNNLFKCISQRDRETETLRLPFLARLCVEIFVGVLCVCVFFNANSACGIIYSPDGV